MPSPAPELEAPRLCSLAQHTTSLNTPPRSAHHLAQYTTLCFETLLREIRSFMTSRDLIESKSFRPLMPPPNGAQIRRAQRVCVQGFAVEFCVHALAERTR
ncbi:MAG: hypothetical protein AAF355_09905 [Myxococcota bacterium]